jgi:hypothetical protein
MAAVDMGRSGRDGEHAPRWVLTAAAWPSRLWAQLYINAVAKMTAANRGWGSVSGPMMSASLEI